MLTKDEVNRLAPRLSDWQLWEESDFDLNWRTTDGGDGSHLSIFIEDGGEHNGKLTWLASREVAKDDCKLCKGVVFAEGVIETEQDLKLPFSWLETQNHSLLSWGD